MTSGLIWKFLLKDLFTRNSLVNKPNKILLRQLTGRISTRRNTKSKCSLKQTLQLMLPTLKLRDQDLTVCIIPQIPLNLNHKCIPISPTSRAWKAISSHWGEVITPTWCNNLLHNCLLLVVKESLSKLYKKPSNLVSLMVKMWLIGFSKSIHTWVLSIYMQVMKIDSCLLVNY